MEKKQLEVRFSERMIILTRIVIVLFFVITWEMSARYGWVSVHYTSMPSAIMLDLIQFTASGDLMKHAGITLYEAWTGLLYGSVVGVTVGLLFGQFPTVGRVLNPIITAIHGIPQLTLAPVYILWFGIGFASKIFLASLMVFFGVFFATYQAVVGMDRRLIESATLLGASKIQILWHVVIPTCAPWIIMGVRAGVGASLIGAIVGEYMGSSAGFGWMVSYATSYFNIKRVMSCIIILLLVGLMMNNGLDRLERYILRWRGKSSLSLSLKE